jgi:starch-binding outer membrane protein, SusD/RagB family
MRKYKLYIIIAGLLTFSSCGEDYLDTESYTELNESTFYKTPADAFNGLAGVYDGYQRMYDQAWSIQLTSEICSDNAFGGGGVGEYGGERLDQFDVTVDHGSNNMFDANWKGYYAGIFRCNAFLGNIDNVNWGDNEALKNQYAAEARFIRAAAYFDLVRLFENVVLLAELSSENLPQANPDDVYKLIAEDLTFAGENIPAVPYAAQPASEHGRVTKWAADALLARVYLFYTGYYKKADLAGVTKQQVLDKLENLIQNSGHGLVDDFASLWPAASGTDYAGERNPENIFNIKATYTSGYNGNDNTLSSMDGNRWMVMMGLRGGHFPPYGQGWGFASVNPELWDAYSDTDTRKLATIISVDDEGVSGVNPANFNEYTGYYNKKYTPMSSYVDGVAVSLADQLGGVDWQLCQYLDFTVVRYADVLLMAAELGSANAQTYFDQVRQRAYQDDFTSIPVTPDNILNERRLEFAFEGIRYWDLLRQGLDVAASTIEGTADVLSGGIPTTETVSAANIINTRGFQMIPNTQITLSGGVLEQNEGWK